MPNNMKKAGIKYQNGGTGMDGPIPKPKKNPGMPKPANYIGNPMGYFNDKAMYGKEKAQDGVETEEWSYPAPVTAFNLMKKAGQYKPNVKNWKTKKKKK